MIGNACWFSMLINCLVEFRLEIQTSLDAARAATVVYQSIPLEAPNLPPGGGTALPPGWPSSGRVEVKGLTLRYDCSAAKAPALSGLSFEVPAGSTLGVVGRTGAGSRPSSAP